MARLKTSELERLVNILSCKMGVGLYVVRDYGRVYIKFKSDNGILTCGTLRECYNEIEAMISAIYYYKKYH